MVVYVIDFLIFGNNFGMFEMCVVWLEENCLC